jgi:Zn-dependent peptidase ImmA (M78 family)
MSKSVEALINPDLLKWGRESINFDIETVAEKLKKNTREIQAWEKGEKYPKLGQLRYMANLYKRPLAFFYLPKPPIEEPMPNDFRTLPSLIDFPLSKQFILEVRKARRIRQIALELAKNSGIDCLCRFIETDINTNIKELAVNVRNILGIPIERQFQFKTEKIAFNEWRDTLEKQKIIVTQGSLPIEETRGFSISKKEFPVIFINYKDSYNGKIFSLFHELAHLMLNQSAISDIKQENYPDENIQKIEVFCNSFAGEFLVPDPILKKAVDNNAKSYWNDDEIKNLAKKFSVSKFVIIRRLLDTKLTDLSFYQLKQNEYLEEQKKGGFGPRNYAKEDINKNSVFYTKLVMQNYFDGNISYAELCNFLNTKTKRIPTIEKIIKDKGY